MVIEEEFDMIIAKTFRFEAGHRLMYHEGKCANVHGHNYRVELYVQGIQDEKHGVVVDFAHLKPFQEWLDKHWDHAMILNAADFEWTAFCRNQGTKMFEFQQVEGGEPTAETMVRYLFIIAKNLFENKGAENIIEVKKVVVYETDDCFAEYE